MIRVSDIRVPAGAGEEHVRNKVAHLLRTEASDMREFRVLKKATDARKKDILDVYTVAVSVDGEEGIVKKCGKSNVSIMKEVKYHCPIHGTARSHYRPIIIGFGPAGIFASLILAQEGYRPVVYERGRCIGERVDDVQRFFDTGVLDPDSNVQFGEGGAGAFSDGKLSTGIKDREGRKEFVLDTLIRHGADEQIRTDSHPHIGTDRLREIMPSIRREIEELGGEIHFGCALDDIIVLDGSVEGIVVSGRQGGIISCDNVFLCLGHSARDTFKMLYDAGFDMEAKPFAVGVRAEHKRYLIDGALHQESASYKLTYHASDGRGVYSFCMCPGGYVVNASSEKGRLTVNGMSYSARGGENSNAAIVCTVSPGDYMEYGDDALAGVRLQRDIEKKAFDECGGAIPYQRYGDFKKNMATETLGDLKPCCKGSYGLGNIRNILPDFVCDDIIEAMPSFGRKISGFDGDDTLFAGVEARTSSPVRIIRNDDMQAVNISGAYTVGEGAGYAGGIMSAAIDGMKAAEKYIMRYKEL